VSRPIDQTERDRFANEIERNFSVIAAAGSGKTYAITDRIVRIALSRKAEEILPRLVVVTFTHRAADEMQQRTRQRILEEVRVPEIHTAFNRAFFGTIHSFCMKLLTKYGHYLGLPTTLDLVTDDEDVWEEFVQQNLHVGHTLNTENRARLFRLAQARQLMELGRNAPSVLAPDGKIDSCPIPDFRTVEKAIGRGTTAAIRNIADSKTELAEFKQRYQNEDWEFVRWPVRASNGKEFVELWNDAFKPLRQWVTDAAMCVATEVQRDYRDFRLAHGVVTYLDQVALADELMQHPIAGRLVREENLRVLLDEAQDTDPVQFSVLTEIARPPAVTGRWLETKTDPPRPGHFCMVGDRQQSIYHDRADLRNYLAIHDALVKQEDADELKFSVTFRLDEEQLRFVNETFRQILNGQEGQVHFVELQPRPEVLPGQVIRVSLGKKLLPEGKLRDYQKARHAAQALAEWIHKTGTENLRAEAWRDVAILCPRKAWLRMIATELRKLGVPVAIQSESDLKGDDPAHAWLTALCTIMSDPSNSYEIVGVLREVFGISDQDLALFSEGDGSRFRIDIPATISGVVSSPLRLLAEIRAEMTGRALFDAVNILIARTQLRERLATLPADDFPTADSDLDTLIALTATAEAEGATLEDFAAGLRADFLTSRDVRLSSENGLQLITAQKAKGSEWQAVILPFLGRDVRPPPPRYPCFLKIPGEAEPIVALNKDDFERDNRDIVKLANQQEAARLLYVAATRARHSLVLVDDGEIFLSSRNTLPNNAQLRHFGEHGTTILTNISSEARVCQATTRAKSRNAKSEAPESLAVFEKRDREIALKHAQEFIHKINPSAYEPDVDLEQIDLGMPRGIPLRTSGDNLATLHGRWWHLFFQRVRWREGLSSVDRLFRELHARAPDRKRAAIEWKCVREGLFAGEIGQRLAAANAHARAEFPFSWRVAQNTVLEGVIDLLLIEENETRCLLVDWKTNDISASETELLRVRYRPQLAAYWKAVSEITQIEVIAGLFSTALGRLLLYETSELEEEWRRLEKLPPNRITEETSIP
jgi:ATP-dependent helicase/nuclease subunit A